MNRSWSASPGTATRRSKPCSNPSSSRSASRRGWPISTSSTPGSAGSGPRAQFEPPGVGGDHLRLKGGRVIMVQVKIPTPLRKYTGGAGGVEADGGTVAALADDLERRYPGLKERICDEDGLARGALVPGKTILDSTSGNTGIALAMVGAALGYPVELVMPGNVSAERKKVVAAFGAKVIYSDPLEGSDGAIRLCRRILAEAPERYFKPDQYNNAANSLAHYETTGPEIWRQTERGITHFVAGIGTGGTIMGTGRYLKERNPAIQVVAAEPDDAFHGLEGL